MISYRSLLLSTIVLNDKQVAITPQPSMSIATMEEEIVDVDVKLNHAVRQQFSITLSHTAFQDWAIISWLDMAGVWYQ